MMASDRVAKLEKKLERGINKSLEIFDSLDEGQWERKISDAADAWTIKELLGHFVYSEDYLLRIAQDIASGGGGAPEGTDIDEFNKNELRKYAQIPASDLLNRLKERRRGTIDWVRELDDSTLDKVGDHPTLGPSTVETVIISIYAHHLLHIRESAPYLKRE
jgi:hypothetical protein